jgi:hypothetical protein
VAEETVLAVVTVAEEAQNRAKRNQVPGAGLEPHAP